AKLSLVAQRFMTELVPILQEHASLCERLLGRALSPPADKRCDFFLGFHEGLATGGVGIRPRDNTLLLVLMLSFDDLKTRFDTVAELHKWLTAAIGENL